MIDYNKMSDLQINNAVAKAAGISHAVFIPESDDDFDEEITDRGPVWEINSGSRVSHWISKRGCTFNPCNNPADAWPIIVDSRMTLYPYSESIYRVKSHGRSFFHENPLRAAMIVFLMMKEKKI